MVDYIANTDYPDLRPIADLAFQDDCKRKIINFLCGESYEKKLCSNELFINTNEFIEIFVFIFEKIRPDISNKIKSLDELPIYLIEILYPGNILDILSLPWGSLVALLAWMVELANFTIYDEEFENSFEFIENQVLGSKDTEVGLINEQLELEYLERIKNVGRQICEVENQIKEIEKIKDLETVLNNLRVDYENKVKEKNIYEISVENLYENLNNISDKGQNLSNEVVEKEINSDEIKKLKQAKVFYIYLASNLEENIKKQNIKLYDLVSRKNNIDLQNEIFKLNNFMQSKKIRNEFFLDHNFPNLICERLNQLHEIYNSELNKVMQIENELTKLKKLDFDLTHEIEEINQNFHKTESEACYFNTISAQEKETNLQSIFNKKDEYKILKEIILQNNQQLFNNQKLLEELKANGNEKFQLLEVFEKESQFRLSELESDYLNLLENVKKIKYSNTKTLYAAFQDFENILISFKSS
jgi:hypothetical protein